MERPVILFLHFIGFGLLVTINVAGFILNKQYKKAPDIQSKGVILRSLRPLGLLSPLAILLMLLTGIGNMHSLGFSVLDLPGWLAYKIMLFVIAAISGTLFGITSRKRSVLIQLMAQGKAPADADKLLQSYEKQVSLSYIVMPILILIILSLSIYGRLGGQ